MTHGNYYRKFIRIYLLFSSINNVEAMELDVKNDIIHRYTPCINYINNNIPKIMKNNKYHPSSFTPIMEKNNDYSIILYSTFDPEKKNIILYMLYINYILITNNLNICSNDFFGIKTLKKKFLDKKEQIIQVIKDDKQQDKTVLNNTIKELSFDLIKLYGQLFNNIMGTNQKFYDGNKIIVIEEKILSDVILEILPTIVGAVFAPNMDGNEQKWIKASKQDKIIASLLETFSLMKVKDDREYKLLRLYKYETEYMKNIFDQFEKGLQNKLEEQSLLYKANYENSISKIIKTQNFEKMLRLITFNLNDLCNIFSYSEVNCTYILATRKIIHNFYTAITIIPIKEELNITDKALKKFIQFIIILSGDKSKQEVLEPTHLLLPNIEEKNDFIIAYILLNIIISSKIDISFKDTKKYINIENISETIDNISKIVINVGNKTVWSLEKNPHLLEEYQPIEWDCSFDLILENNNIQYTMCTPKPQKVKMSFQNPLRSLKNIIVKPPIQVEKRLSYGFHNILIYSTQLEHLTTENFNILFNNTNILSKIEVCCNVLTNVANIKNQQILSTIYNKLDNISIYLFQKPVQSYNFINISEKAIPLLKTWFETYIDQLENSISKNKNFFTNHLTSTIEFKFIFDDIQGDKTFSLESIIDIVYNLLKFFVKYNSLKTFEIITHINYKQVDLISPILKQKLNFKTQMIYALLKNNSQVNLTSNMFFILEETKDTNFNDKHIEEIIHLKCGSNTLYVTLNQDKLIESNKKV